MGIANRFFKAIGRYFKRTWKPALITLLVLTAIHGIATIILGHIYEQKISAIKSQGDPVFLVELAGKPVPDSENGAVIYERIFKLLPGIDKSFDERIFQSKEREAHPELWSQAKAFCEKYKTALDMAQLAARKPKCRFKTNWEAGFGALFPYCAKLRNVARCLALRALVEAREGKKEMALRDIRTVFMLPGAIKDDPTLIHMLVRIHLVQIGVIALEEAANYIVITEQEAKHINQEVSSINIEDHLKLAFKGERAIQIWANTQPLEEMVAFMSNTDESVLKTNLVIDYTARPWRYLDNLALLDYMSKVIKYTDIPYRKAHKIKGLGFDRYDLPWYAIISKIITPAYKSMISHRDRGRSSIDGTQVFLGILAYKDRFNEYPSTLDELKTKLEWLLKEDPFSGQNFVYKRQGKGFILYSIGKNMKDDGGQNNIGKYGKSEKPGLDDIVWKMDK